MPFFSNKWFPTENATYAALTAAFTANVVLVSYVIVAVLEDKQAERQAPVESKKDK